MIKNKMTRIIYTFLSKRIQVFSLITFLILILYYLDGVTEIDERLARLGKKLFFDKILSGNNSISCASCHNPAKGWFDGRAQAIGFNGIKLTRRTPTLINVGLQQFYFWDGRSPSLEDQAKKPITNQKEMNLPQKKLEEKINQHRYYRSEFKQILGVTHISLDHVAMALAAFQRTIRHGPTPYQRWLEGDDSALSESAQQGFRLFISERVGCFRCHHGENLTDQRLWDIGVNTKDRGAGRFNFKTPTLWGVADRGPYMHNGSEKTLEDVLDLYSKGGRVLRPSLSPLIKPINLTHNEKRQLIAFLKSLSEDAPQNDKPPLPPTEEVKHWYESDITFK